MRLDYDKSIPSDPAALVLTAGGGNRVEIHLRREADGTATLLAFAGTQAQPARQLQQGPFSNLGQAVAARRAIAGQLLQNGYQLDPGCHPIWSLLAQQAIRTARRRKLASRADYRFDPQDVFLDW